MTATDSEPVDATNEPASSRPGEVWVLLVLALVGLIQRGGAIERWLNRRLGTVTSGGTSIEEVGRTLAEVADERADPDAAEGPGSGGQTEPAVRESVREAQLRYLNGICDDVRAELGSDQTKIDRYEQYDLLVIRARLMAGALTLVLAILGVLLAATGYLPLGLVSGAVALIPGAGTIGLTRVTELLDKRLTFLRGRQQGNRETLRSVEAMLAIGDDALLDAELSKLAQRFAASSGGNGDT